MDDYQKFIHQSKYARWNEDKGRRETWQETVDRYCSFFSSKFATSQGIPEYINQTIKPAILKQEVMPSMRAMFAAGPALERENLAGYNCSYLAIDKVRNFSEVLYVLMCGTGVGFSVERQEINKLPEIPPYIIEDGDPIVVEDSKEGWARAFNTLLDDLYNGYARPINYSFIRPAGARLKVFGGRASGPKPLKELFEFTVSTFKKAAGRKLTSLECHDIVCETARIVVVGGVRRSALISLSNLSDERMRDAKAGQWWVNDAQRALANNSAAYTEKPDIGVFINEWKALYESKSGERGIFNRQAAQAKAKASGRRDSSYSMGTNPCAEIILRNKGLCNLSEVVLRAEDTFEDIERKVEIATVIGTLQSSLTNFGYVSNDWKKNAEEERLLGVSLTGICDSILGSMDTPGLRPTLEVFLQRIKKHAIETNRAFSERIGINPSVAITTVKPSGTVSQLVDSSSGIHARHSPFYIRTVRNDNKDPLTAFLKSQNVPWEACVMNPENTTVFSFPQAAPKGALINGSKNAVEQLDFAQTFTDNWCEHNTSVTVSVKDHEWMDAGAWVFKHFDKVGGVSFLPYSDHVYQQAPYQEITEEEYLVAKESFPVIDWEKFKEFEKEDSTTSAQELACVGVNSCEIL